MYSLEFAPEWSVYFSKMDKTVQQRVWKKIQQLKESTASRHLRFGMPYFVAEVGQYRIVYDLNEERQVKRIHFVGDHKQYERWLGI